MAFADEIKKYLAMSKDELTERCRNDFDELFNILCGDENEEGFISFIMTIFGGVAVTDLKASKDEYQLFCDMIRSDIIDYESFKEICEEIDRSGAFIDTVSAVVENVPECQPYIKDMCMCVCVVDDDIDVTEEFLLSSGFDILWS